MARPWLLVSNAGTVRKRFQATDASRAGARSPGHDEPQSGCPNGSGARRTLYTAPTLCLRLPMPVRWSPLWHNKRRGASKGLRLANLKSRQKDRHMRPWRSSSTSSWMLSLLPRAALACRTASFSWHAAGHPILNCRVEVRLQFLVEIAVPGRHYLTRSDSKDGGYCICLSLPIALLPSSTYPRRHV